MRDENQLIRFGLAIEKGLLKKFDDYHKRKGYKNRSEALRDLIRNGLVEQEWRGNKEVIGVLCFIYDHHIRELTEKLNDVQHHFKQIISSMHIHLDKDHCLEVVVAKGLSRDIERIAGRILGLKGVKHGRLLTTTAAKGL